MIRFTSRFFALTAAAGLLVSVAAYNTASGRDLVEGPEDQFAPIGQTVTFEVQPRMGQLSYQWVRQWPEGFVVLGGQTNQTLTITNAGISDVGLYLCVVNRGEQTEITPAAALVVAEGQSSSLSSSQSFGTLSGDSGGPLTLYAPPVVSSGSQGACPGAYAGYVNFRRTISQGWGWAPSAGTTNHTASDNVRSDTKVEYVGKFGDSGCQQTTVSVPDPTTSPKYRFTIYFPDNVPTTNAYPITLTGFDP